MVALEGQYKLEKSEKFDEYMKAIGVGFALRKMGASATPTLTVTRDGDKFNIKTETTFKTSVLEFELGKEFKETTMDGREVNSVVVLEGNKLIQTQTKDDFKTTIAREFDDSGLTAVATYGDIVSTRRYARL